MGIRSIELIMTGMGDDFNLKLGEMSGDSFGNDQHPVILHWNNQNSDSVLNNPRRGKSTNQ